MRVLLKIAYDGTDFCGYQVQPNKRTVESELKLALDGLLKEDVKLVASGRTDSGVHALSQCVHFDITLNIVFGIMRLSLLQVYVLRGTFATQAYLRVGDFLDDECIAFWEDLVHDEFLAHLCNLTVQNVGRGIALTTDIPLRNVQFNVNVCHRKHY